MRLCQIQTSGLNVIQHLFKVSCTKVQFILKPVGIFFAIQSANYNLVDHDNVKLTATFFTCL